jgi:hypothetical protein
LVGGGMKNKRPLHRMELYNEAVVMATQGRKNNNNESDNLSYISDVMWRSRWPAGGCWDIIF